MKRLLIPAILFAGVLAIAIISCERTATESADNPELTAPQPVLMKETNVMFTGEEDHSITLAAAEQMMAAFQKDNPYDTYGWFFGRKAIEALLAQDGCVGIRIYGGLNQDGQFSPVLFGVTAKGDDIGGGGLSKALFDSTVVGPREMTVPCPPFCGGGG